MVPNMMEASAPHRCSTRRQKARLRYTPDTPGRRLIACEQPWKASVGPSTTRFTR